jgi:hypothetical protein
MVDEVALEALREGQRLIAEDAASLGLYQRSAIMAHRTYVKDFIMHPQAGGCWHFLDTYIERPPHAVSAAISPSENSGPAGSELYYTVTVTNRGTENDNYALDVSDNAGWILTLSNNLLEVPSGENRTTMLAVTIPENAVPCTEDTIIVTVTSQENMEVSDNASCIAHVLETT